MKNSYIINLQEENRLNTELTNLHQATHILIIFFTYVHLFPVQGIFTLLGAYLMKTGTVFLSLARISFQWKRRLECNEHWSEYCILMSSRGGSLCLKVSTAGMQTYSIAWNTDEKCWEPVFLALKLIGFIFHFSMKKKTKSGYWGEREIRKMVNTSQRIRPIWSKKMYCWKYNWAIKDRTSDHHHQILPSECNYYHYCTSWTARWCSG